MKELSKRQQRKNAGYLTIEASVIVPVILLAVMMILAGLIIIYEQGSLYAEEVESLYTIPLDTIRDGSVQNYLSGISYGDGLEFGSICTSPDYSHHKALCEGELSYREEFEINSTREIDVLVDRLRRWQLYDDISETSGEQ